VVYRRYDLLEIATFVGQRVLSLNCVILVSRNAHQQFGVNEIVEPGLERGGRYLQILMEL